jgi:hypothetical protein
MTTQADRPGSGPGSDPVSGEVKELGIAGGELYEESLKAGVDAAELSPGMAVVSADDQPLGEVSAVRPNCVVVKRMGRTDLYVPLGSVLEARGGRVVVNTLANQLDRLGWETPPSTVSAR